MHTLNDVDEFGFRPFEDIDALNCEIEAHIAEYNKNTCHVRLIGCTRCNGSGEIGVYTDTYELCHECDGSGEFYCTQFQRINP